MLTKEQREERPGYWMPTNKSIPMSYWAEICGETFVPPPTREPIQIQ